MWCLSTPCRPVSVGEAVVARLGVLEWEGKEGEEEGEREEGEEEERGRGRGPPGMPWWGWWR